MDLDRFWSIVDTVKDSSEPESAVAEELRKLPPEEIVSFQERMDRLRDRAYTWDLWGAAYILQGGCSDDGFEYFRLGLISKGREVYENVLKSPDSLADLELAGEEGLDGELFGYAAMEVYEDMTGNEMPMPTHTGMQEPEGEQWDFDDAAERARRMPRLTAKFAEFMAHYEPPSQVAGPKEPTRPQNKPWWKFW